MNRIFGTSKTSVQTTNLDSDSHVALATYKTAIGNFSGYVYALDFRRAPALSSMTAGVSYSGTLNKLAINAGIASQSDHGNNGVDYRATYLSADLGLDAGPVRFLLGYELLGSDDGIAAFATPLATLHKWQGWADLFLATPADGIEDAYGTLSGKIGAALVSATYHRFDSDEGGREYGDEWDLVVSYPVLNKLSAELKYATYDAETLAVDTDKLWLTLNLRF